MKALNQTIAAFLILVLAACATIKNPLSVQAMGEQGAIQFLVIKELDNKKAVNPEKAQALAKNAREAIKQIGIVLDGGSLSGLTFQELHYQVTKIIAAQNYDAATLVAVGTLRDMADMSLKDVQNNTTLIPGNLTPQEIAGIKIVLAKIDEAITLAGY